MCISPFRLLRSVLRAHLSKYLPSLGSVFGLHSFQDTVDNILTCFLRFNMPLRFARLSGLAECSFFINVMSKLASG